MIKRYSDHAANERTFLAWVRTAIAVMAFRFVIEKFDLFTASHRTARLRSSRLRHTVKSSPMPPGLAFIAIGVVMIVIAGARFTQTAKAIEIRDQLCRVPANASISHWSTLIGLLGAALFSIC